MGKLTLEEAIKLYNEGSITFRGVYDACETDLDFYNFLTDEYMDEDKTKEIMREVTGADDAYYNALAMAETEDLWQ